MVRQQTGGIVTFLSTLLLKGLLLRKFHGIERKVNPLKAFVTHSIFIHAI
jgi:hypothetical protein